MTRTIERKNPARVMVLSLAGIAMAALLGPLGAARAQNAVPVFAADAYTGYTADVANGEYMFAAAGCGACHSAENDPTLLSGGLIMKTSPGTFYVPNISPDPEHGIGGWSNARFLNAVMRGLHEDGSHLYPVMPYTSYAGMKPEDVLDIKAYIDGLRPSNRPNQSHDIQAIFNINQLVGVWKANNPFVADWAPGEPSQMRRGEYLVKAVGHCAECHTKRDADWGLDHSREFMGETGLTGAFAPPITADELKKHPMTAFTVDVLQEGKKLVGGFPLTDPTMKKLTQGWRELKPEDRVAIYAYLVGEAQPIPTEPVEDPVDPNKPDPQVNPDKPDPEDEIDSVAEDKPFEWASLAAPMCAADEFALAAAQQRRAQPNDEPIVTEEAAPAAVVSSGPSELDIAAEAFIGTYCRSCHGLGTPYQTLFPAGDLASIANNPAFVEKGNPDKSILYDTVVNNRMPKGPKPTREEIENLAAWIRSLDKVELEPVVVEVQPREEDEPEAEPVVMPDVEPREIITREQEVDAALRDIGEVDELDRSYIRYFSLRTQYNAVYPCETEERFAKRLQIFRAGFLKLLNSLSYGASITTGVEVEGTKGLLLRVDIRDLEWSTEQYDALVNRYFYGVDPRSDPPLNSLAAETETALPIMRTDWFMSFATKPDLYSIMLDLPDDIRIVEDRLGINVNRNIEERDIIRGAFLEGSSGVSDHNRMVERHDQPNGGYYWKSYDFAESINRQNLKQFPHGPDDPNLDLPYDLVSFKHDGGEMIFSLPNGMQAYYLSLANGQFIPAGPTAIVSFRERPIGKGVEVLNGRSCFNCHYDGMVFKRDELREVLDVSTNFSLDEREFLLSIYVAQDELQAAYEHDRDQFVAALDEMGATMETTMGGKTALSGPSGEESVNYYADHYEADLNLDALAAEFDMSADEFKRLAPRLEGETLQIVLNWLALLDSGVLVPRPEVEAQYPYLVETLMRLDPLKTYLQPEAKVEPAETPAYQAVIVEKYQEQGQGEYVAAIEQAKEQYPAAYAQPAELAPENRMSLSLAVPATDVKVQDRLSFTLTSNKDCEVQMFYVESTGAVEALDQAVGDPNLKAGQPKQIPDPKTGFELMFDTTGYEESLVVYCRAGGLKDRRLSPEEARKLANEGGKGSRGLVVQLSDRASEAPAEEATHMVTFNVSQ